MCRTDGKRAYRLLEEMSFERLEGSEEEATNSAIPALGGPGC